MGYIFRYLPYITEKVLLYLIIHLKIIVDLLNVNIFLGKNIFSKQNVTEKSGIVSYLSKLFDIRFHSRQLDS